MAVERRFSGEIQGLRAVAVLSVLFFHIWPHRIPGGYVGVDVFFVISGYLITGALLRELDTHGSISIAGFYQRRIKRLLPAATLTILGVAIAYRLQPVVTWEASAKSIVASTLYSQNWWLAHEATDYWAQGDAPSALQHFWSLAVEEQFYIVWPLLLLLAAWVARMARRSPEKFIRPMILVLGLASLAYCIALSHSNPGLAYFATTTRAWELALGGALALWPPRSNMSQTRSQLLAGGGLAMIVAACFVLDEQTRFPGYAALLPTLGAAAVIAAGSVPSPWSVSRLLRTRLSQFYGDISYSLYLWHWPVLIFYQQLVDEKLSLSDGVIVFVLSGALAHQSKICVEDPFRKRGVFDKRRWHTFAFAILCMATTLAAAWWIDRAHTRKMDRVEALIQARAEAHETLSFANFDTLDAEDRVLSSLAAKEDMAPWYRSKCRGEKDSVDPIPCVYGDEKAAFEIVLIGDSHAVHWEPAFIRLAKLQSWKFSIFAKTACSVGDHPVTIGKKPRVYYETCDTYRTRLLDLLKREKPDLVIISQSSAHVPYHGGDEPKEQVIAASLVRTVRALEAEGIQVLLLADTPWFRRPVPECLSDPKYRPGSCDVSMNIVRKRKDPVLILGRAHPDIGVLKMNRHFCDQKSCKAIIDGKITYKDAHHLTATFAATLSEQLLAEISRFLAPTSATQD